MIGSDLHFRTFHGKLLRTVPWLRSRDRDAWPSRSLPFRYVFSIQAAVGTGGAKPPTSYHPLGTVIGVAVVLVFVPGGEFLTISDCYVIALNEKDM